MKKRLLFSLLLIFSVVLFFPSSSYSQEVTATPSPTPLPQYQLPYPGLLPDHPLYVVKMLRDRIITLLISDSLKKTEFNLLQADKRLAAGLSLFKKGNQELAESTIAKGENYFEDAIARAEDAQKQGMYTKDIAARLFVASKKHEEAIKELAVKATEKNKKKFETIIKRIQVINEKVSKLNNR